MTPRQTHINHIQPKFTHDRFEFELVRRNEHAAMYRKRKPDWPDGEYTYEVIRVGILKAGLRFGKHYPERENYPPSTAWGTEGFSYNDEQDAIHKFMEMRPKQKQTHSLRIKAGQDTGTGTKTPPATAQAR